MPPRGASQLSSHPRRTRGLFETVEAPAGSVQHADVHALHVEGERGKQNTHRLPFSSCLIYKTFAFLHCYIHSVRYQLPNIYLNLIRALIDVSSNTSQSRRFSVTMCGSHRYPLCSLHPGLGYMDPLQRLCWRHFAKKEIRDFCSARPDWRSLTSF